LAVAGGAEEAAIHGDGKPSSRRLNWSRHRGTSRSTFRSWPLTRTGQPIVSVGVRYEVRRQKVGGASRRRPFRLTAGEMQSTIQLRR
jgi:hypothetical protein